MAKKGDPRWLLAERIAAELQMPESGTPIYAVPCGIK
jgi:hypothetical protein